MPLAPRNRARLAADCERLANVVQFAEGDVGRMHLTAVFEPPDVERR